MSLDPKSTITRQTLAAGEEKEAAKDGEKEVDNNGMTLRNKKVKYSPFLLTMCQQQNNKKQKKLLNRSRTRT